MNKLCVLVVALTALAGPLASPARASAPALGQALTIVATDQAQAAEAQRRQILAAHSSWRWVVQVEAKAGSETKAGMLLGMQGIGTTGPVRSLAWMNAAGEVQWMALDHVEESGTHVFQVRDDFTLGTEPSWKGTTAGAIAQRVSVAIGTKVGLETLHAWVSGLPSGSSAPTRLAKDEAGVHPVDASLDQGQIVWTHWSSVETGRGQSMALPGGWSLARKNYQAVFLSVSIEAYEANELPNRGWPFIVKEDAGKFQPQEEPPIARDDQLDYDQW